MASKSKRLAPAQGAKLAPGGTPPGDSSPGDRGSERRPIGLPPLWVRILVVAHVLAITVWALPNPPDGISGNRVNPVGSDYLLVWNHDYIKPSPLLHAYMVPIGMAQYWDMFAPNPSGMDLFGDAQVTYRSGRKRTVDFAHMATLSIPMKYFKERYRKYFERARLDESAYMWPPLAAWIANQADDRPEDPPARVALFRHWQMVMPPGKPPEIGYSQYKFYEWVVDPVKLSRPHPRGIGGIR